MKKKRLINILKNQIEKLILKVEEKKSKKISRITREKISRITREETLLKRIRKKEGKVFKRFKKTPGHNKISS